MHQELAGGLDRALSSTVWRRIVPAEQTVARLKPLLPVFGITRLANVTGLDTIGIPVVMCNRPNSRALAVSQGKGVTLAAAKASAVMESIESWHAERITLPLKIGAFEDLCYSHHMADPDKLPRYADSQWTPYSQALWVEGQSLAHRRGTWVPFEMVHTNYTLPLPTGHGGFQCSSNGLASGNHILEAVIHGLCEVIERDALTLWHLKDAAAQEDTRLDLETVADPTCRDLIARFQKAGVEVGVWDITSDTGVPAFLCRIVQANGDHAATIRPATGCGASLVREIALSRALTEAAQSRLTFIAGARDDMQREDYERFLTGEEQGRWLARLRREAPTRDFNQLPTWEGLSLRQDLDALTDRLARVGIDDVIVIDLTRPEFNIPVVRVIVPGLEGVDHAGYALGRRARAAKGL